MLEIHDIPKADLMELASRVLEPDVKETIMSTYEQLIQEGKELGLQEGARRVLLRLLTKRFKDQAQELMSRIDPLSPSQQEELSEMLLDGCSLDEIHDWLKGSIRH